MDIIGTIFLTVFVALLIGAALWLGLTLLVVLFITGIIMAVLLYTKDIWRRWRFVQMHMRHEQQEQKGGRVIEGEYKDISDKK